MKNTFTAENLTYHMNTVATVFRELKDCLVDYGGIISPNWGFILQCISGGNRYLTIEASDGDGSDFAAAKIATLEKFPEMAVVGVSNLEELKALLDGYYHDKEDEDLQKILKIADLHPKAHPKGLLLPESWEWLRTHARISPWRGAIRVPYSQIICNGNGVQNVNGQILIGFSGANEHYDLVIAIRMFYALQLSWAIYQKNIQHTYHLEKIKEDKIAEILLEENSIRMHDKIIAA